MFMLMCYAYYVHFIVYTVFHYNVIVNIKCLYLCQGELGNGLKFHEKLGS